MKTSLGMGGLELEERKINLVYGSLLHAIGKVIKGSRAMRKTRVPLGPEWFRRLSDNEKIAQQIAKATSVILTDWLLIVWSISRQLLQRLLQA